jgi:hypothetical protein
LKDGDAPNRQWLLRLQSAYVLPLARGIYLIIALACLITVVGGGIYILFLQASTTGAPAQEPLPPTYQGSSTSRGLPAREIDLDAIERRLAVPDNVKFSVTKGPIREPLAEGTILGHFDANTANELAPYPDGISVLGGPDAPLFDRVRGKERGSIALAPRPELLAEIESRLEALQAPEARRFELRVVARDQYGITSAPADISFELKLAPPATEPADEAEEAAAEPALTEVQKIARDIAQTLEPTVNPAHFAVYRTASEVPGRCGAEEDDRAFLASYRRAFDRLRASLTTTNVEAFYQGLCDGWKAVLEEQSAARKQAEQQAKEARRAAEAARSRVAQRNAQVLRAHEAEVRNAKAQTAVVLSVIGAALATFLSVALILAFLAIEGHSRAVRAAVESMARMNTAKPTPVNEEASGGA